MPALTTVPPATLLLEVTTFTASMLVLDRVEKASGVEVAQMELNDYYGVVLKLCGAVSAIESAAEEASALEARFHCEVRCASLLNPSPSSVSGIFLAEEFQPLLRQKVVCNPLSTTDSNMTDSTKNHTALGFIETQGFIASMAALDSATKAAQVELVGREKLGGGYITIVLAGDVGAVEAAVEAGVAAVRDLGNLIASEVISRPSSGVLGLLETVKLPAPAKS
ncbi:MAG: BMC domain-containing protein [Verrucomicrobiota bacterium]